MPVQNLAQLLMTQVQQRPDKGALFSKIGGVYRAITYRDLADKVASFAAFLKSEGVKKNDKVVIYAHNCPEWVIADFATLLLGAVSVPIYPTLGDEQSQYIIQNSEAKIAVVEGQNQFDNISPLLETKLKRVIGISTINSDEDVAVTQFSVALAQNQVGMDSFKWDTVVRSQLASIVYTSGTTGVPKGVQLSHDNFLSNVEDICEVFPFSDKEVVLSFLPLSHVFERTAGYYTVLSLGGSIYYAESMDTIGDNIRESKPTVVVSVPRLYEKIQGRVLDGLKGIKKPIFYWAQKVGSTYQRALKNGSVSGFLKLKHSIADRLVFEKVRQRTGGRLRFFVSGGAPLGKSLGEFFENMGILIIEGYGLTETSPVIAANTPDDYRIGTVGRALPRVETKVSEEGELLVKGPSIMLGYYKMPVETKEVLESDGWFHTGDIVEIDKEGFIRIVDRKKDLIVLSNGKKVAPQFIEGILLQSPYISQVVVVGEKRNYISALIVPNIEKLETLGWCKAIMASHPLEWVHHQDVRQFIWAEIEALCVHLGRYQHIKRFALLSSEFTQEAGELTPTLKIKRRVIRERFANEIEGLYKETT